MSKSTQAQLEQVRKLVAELWPRRQRHAEYCRPDSREGCSCWRATQRLNAHSLKTLG